MANAETIDKAVADGIAQMREKDIESAWDRYEQQMPQCGFGELGICCRNCFMGPCRIDLDPLPQPLALDQMTKHPMCRG